MTPTSRHNAATVSDYSWHRAMSVGCVDIDSTTSAAGLKVEQQSPPPHNSMFVPFIQQGSGITAEHSCLQQRLTFFVHSRIIFNSINSLNCPRLETYMFSYSRTPLLKTHADYSCDTNTHIWQTTIILTQERDAQLHFVTYSPLPQRTKRL